MNPPRITLELSQNSLANRDFTHHPKWARHVGSLAHPERHIFIAAAKTATGKGGPHRPLPESLHPLLREEYIRWTREHPDLATGKVPWVHETQYPLNADTYAIATPFRDLPFKDGVVRRVVANSWVAQNFLDINAHENGLAKTRMESELIDTLREVHRVLPKGGRFEIHEPTHHRSSISSAFGGLFHFTERNRKVNELESTWGDKYPDILQVLGQFVIKHHTEQIPVMEGGGRTHWFELLKRR